jgi:hypothetical protein
MQESNGNPGQDNESKDKRDKPIETSQTSTGGSGSDPVPVGTPPPVYGGPHGGSGHPDKDKK